MPNAKKVQRTVRPGARGTLRYVRRYGDALVAVRYRYDAARDLRYTTVELVVDERPWIPGGRTGVLVDSMEPPERVFVEVSFHEGQLRARVRNAGGRWDPKRRAWELPFETVKRMGLEGRIQFKTK
jgi:hypothetical protein